MYDCPVSLRLLLFCGGLATLPACAQQGGALPGSGPAATAHGPAASELADSSTFDAGPAGVRCSGKAGALGDTNNMIEVGGDVRRYLLHVPPSYDPTIPTQLVVAYHGFTASPEDARDETHFDEVADARGFLVAYPAGRFGAWNAGACCGVPVATGIDDTGFSRAILDELEDRYCVDARRVFATGFSNGGFMSHRLGCELSDRFAAIAVVSGQEAIATCAPLRAVPVVQVHGTADPVVPYGGNPVLGFPSTQATIDGWADRDGCGAVGTTLSQDGPITCVGRNGCSAGAEVILCTNAGGGHEWPAGGTSWTASGPPAGFVTTLYFADFFTRHPMP